MLFGRFGVTSHRFPDDQRHPPNLDPIKPHRTPYPLLTSDRVSPGLLRRHLPHLYRSRLRDRQVRRRYLGHVHPQAGSDDEVCRPRHHGRYYRHCTSVTLGKRANGRRFAANENLATLIVRSRRLGLDLG